MATGTTKKLKQQHGVMEFRLLNSGAPTRLIMSHQINKHAQMHMETSPTGKPGNLLVEMSQFVLKLQSSHEKNAMK